MNRLFVFLVVIFMLSLGFVQEMVKVNINYYLDNTSQVDGFYNLSPEERKSWLNEHRFDVPYDYYYSHTQIDALHQLSLQEISRLKWLMAFIFIGINFLLNWLLLHFTFFKEPFKSNEGRRSKRYLVVLYLGSVVLAGFFFVGGKLIHFEEPSYNIARKLLGFVQSPMPALILWLVFRFLAQGIEKWSRSSE